jgi:hypothetical protein
VVVQLLLWRRLGADLIAHESVVGQALLVVATCVSYQPSVRRSGTDFLRSRARQVDALVSVCATIGAV